VALVPLLLPAVDCFLLLKCSYFCFYFFGVVVRKVATCP
jgi:hypothetical protein